MKKHILLITNIIICLVITFGFFVVTFSSKNVQKKISSEHIENISNLTSLNIHSQIVNTFSESVHVSQTMSNDAFLVDWLLNSEKQLENTDITDIIKYLKKYQVENKYDNVFLVSNKTLIYYYNEGINKIVSPEDSHDVWYYNFVQSMEQYNLVVDYDETNSNLITLFVNCRIEDENDNFLGVVGVGFKINKIQSVLVEHENHYKLKASLIDEKGNIMVRSNISGIIKENYFDSVKDKAFIDNIIANKTSPEIQWVNTENLEKCVITQYVKDFNWYLVIEKDNSEAKAAFDMQFKNNMIIFIIVTIIIMLSVSYIIKIYNDIVRKTANTDQLTGLQNREAFYSNYDKIKQKSEFKNGTFFIFDIDNFKNINDKYGHNYGDDILKYVATSAQNFFNECGILARWGGDEFVGILKENANNKKLLEDFIDFLLKKENPFGHPISISIGISKMSLQPNIKDLVIIADRAMYQAKENGKGKVM
ncbi:MAG: sensor domain-containing diguanylate cyclase [Clostridia bacterium]